MRSTSRLVTVAAMTSMFAASAMAGTLAGADAHQAEAGYGATDPLQKQTMWERAQILALIQQEVAEDAATTLPALKQTWDRGHVLQLIEEQRHSPINTDEAAAPRVKIYFDSTGSEPGLPRSLGNTNAGRSIMLKYLQQAQQNAPSS